MKVRSWISLGISIAASTIAASCSDIEFNNPPPTTASGKKPDPNNQQLQVLPATEVQVSVDALPGPNAYRLVLKAVRGSSSGLLIRKQKASSSPATLIEFPSNGELFDTEVEAGSKYSLEFGRMDGSSFASVQKSEVEIPRDIVRSGVGSLSSDLKTQRGRIFLLEGSVLTVGQNDVSLEAVEIVAQNSIIRTFPKDAEATLGNPGAHGGEVLVKAEKLTGTLRVELVGERGGKGFKGAKGENGPVGPKGPTLSVQQSAGFTHPEIAYWLPRRPDYLNFHPGKGGRGGNGKPGSQGHPGLPGGRTGSLIVNIPGVDPGQISVEQIPGAGGRGGDGGDGGDPGPGGPGGDITGNDACHNAWGSCCPPPPQGPAGDGGSPGPEGPPGIAGGFGKVLINGKEMSR